MPKKQAGLETAEIPILAREKNFRNFLTLSDFKIYDDRCKNIIHLLGKSTQFNCLPQRKYKIDPQIRALESRLSLLEKQ